MIRRYKGGLASAGKATQCFLINGRTTEADLELTFDPRPVVLFDGHEVTSTAEVSCGSLKATAAIEGDGRFHGIWR